MSQRSRASATTKRSRFRVALLCLGLGCLGLAHATAHAQDAGDPAQAEEEEDEEYSLHVMRLDDLHLNFQTLVRADVERLRYPKLGGGYETQKSNKLLIGEKLGLQSEGSFVHPLFWSWQAMGNAFFIEDFLDGSNLILSPDLPPLKHASNQRFVVQPGFDLRSQFLKEQPYPVSVYLKRDTFVARPEFRQNYWMSSLTGGGTASWRNGVFPVIVNYNYLKNEGETADPLNRQVGSEMHQVTVTGQYADKPALLQTEYRMSEYDNQYFRDNHYVFHTLQALDTVNLDYSARYQLESRVRAMQRDFWDSSQSEARLTERLVGRLFPSLRLRLQYDLAALKWSHTSAIQNAGQVELRHQLWRSLTTDAFARILEDYGDTTNRTQEAVAAGTTYKKDLGPLIMTHGYHAMNTWTSFSSAGSQVTVVDERVTLAGTGGIPVRLASPDIDLGSVRVVDVTASIVYLRGLDYELDQRDGVTYIRRLLTGSMPADSTVLVSYDFEAAANQKTSQLYQTYQARLDTDLWTQLRLFAEYDLRDIKNRASIPLDESQRDLTYQDFTVGGNAAGGGANAESHFRYTTSRHYRAYEATGGISYLLPLTDKLRPVVGAREIYLVLEMSDTRQKKNLVEVYTQANYPIFGPVTGRWSVTYRWESGGYNDGHQVWGLTTADWRMNEVLCSIEYALRLELRDTRQYSRHSLTFNLRRGF